MNVHIKCHLLDMYYVQYNIVTQSLCLGGEGDKEKLPNHEQKLCYTSNTMLIMLKLLPSYWP